MKLYAWQQECLTAWEAHHFRGIVHVATGAGKTVLALNAIDLYLSRYPDARVKIVLPTIPLAQQWQTALLHHIKDPSLRPGFYGGGTRDRADHSVMIYIINSARNTLSDHIRRDFALGRHVLLICDECHHYQSPQNRLIFDFAHSSFTAGKQYASLGLSATPFDSPDNTVLIDALGPEIFRYNVSQASADGIVSPFIISEVAVSFLPQEKEAYQQLSLELMLLIRKMLNLWPELRGLSSRAFMKAVQKIAGSADMDPENPAAAFLLKTWERKEISVLADARLLCGLALIAQLPEKERIIIFCERISQAERMARAIRHQYGQVCAVYHSKMSRDARTRNMEAFRNRTVHILVSCRCLDEGIDVPDASVGIVLSSAAVTRQRIQRLGRILRRAEGKVSASLYYLYIQESSDDAAYLPGMESAKTASMFFRSQEQSFENNLYLYAASKILDSAKSTGLTAVQLRELRRCLNEGLARTDYLLPAETRKKLLASAGDTHSKNYWHAMLRLGYLFGPMNQAEPSP